MESNQDGVPSRSLDEIAERAAQGYSTRMHVLPEIEAGKCTVNRHLYTEDDLRKVVDDAQERIRDRHMLVRSSSDTDARTIGIIKALTFDGERMHVAYDILPGQPRVDRITPFFQGEVGDDGIVSHMDLMSFIPFFPLFPLDTKAPMQSEHINANGEFQSDKYPWCKPGFVPLKLTDKMAQPVLYYYARLRESVDAQFSKDLNTCLTIAGYNGWRPDREEKP